LSHTSVINGNNQAVVLSVHCEMWWRDTTAFLEHNIHLFGLSGLCKNIRNPFIFEKNSWIRVFCAFANCITKTGFWYWDF